MVIIWGSRHYGKVDQLDDDGAYVATRFGHLYYIPLIPMGSVLVLEKVGARMRAIDIELSWKSVLFAYLRLALWVAMVPLAVMGFALTAAYLTGPSAHLSDLLAGLGMGAAGVVSAVALFLSYPLSRPGPARRQHLLSLCGHRGGGVDAIPTQF